MSALYQSSVASDGNHSAVGNQSYADEIEPEDGCVDEGGCGVANASLINAAHRLLQPLMLRRLKREVLGGELPPKVPQSYQRK
jgi:hypothetical protein